MGQCCSKRCPEIDDGDVVKPAVVKGLSTIEVSSPQLPASSFNQLRSTTTSTQRRSQADTVTAIRRSSLEGGNNENDIIMSSTSGSPSKDDLYGSSITSSKYIYTSPPSSPSKSSDEPQVEELQDISQQEPSEPVYVAPEDRPIESAFIREERIRLAQIQEHLRIERQEAHEKWVAELREKKKEFLPDVVVYRDFSPRVD
ncbi:hypothetical protein DYB26_009140 [Aphanomyces astaci]|uniref:Uncharacterized protein n=1 Tax=Aphanomyces astaci TaxID=112090 RepID=A0A397BVC5_APHAT|nr:hypothetical protein DYB36_001567 [Aphanomyces astaci]RHY62311.1 hypothetical protein DYB34_001400 [Aphanomyces astaci]RHZ07535.1 hypothetical protein DYB26_009140 [Aphanomyces astaci]